MTQPPPHTDSRIGGEAYSGLAALAHPITLAAAAVLLLNDSVWQRLSPSWWTGKIGDVAWLVIAPLLAAVPLRAFPPLRRLSPRAFIALEALLVALAYSAAKAVPAVNRAALSVGAAFGLSLKLRLDPTDLLALPGLLVAIWVFQHPLRLRVPRWPRRALQAAALAFVALAVIADVGAPTDYGVDCLTRDSTGLIAQREMYQPSDIGNGSTAKTFYRSADAGLTWTLDSKADPKAIDCVGFPKWPAQDPSSPTGQLYFVPGKGLYHSSDQGQTLVLEQPLQRVPDFAIDPATGNFIVAAGVDGIWVKTHAGQWVHALNLRQP